jgi:cytochrome c-type biogenesis protein CcmH/NrfF
MISKTGILACLRLASRIPRTSSRCHPESRRRRDEGPVFSYSPLVTRHSSLSSDLSRAFLLFFLVLLVLLPATAQQTERAKSVGHRMFCMCGCKQILVECNHVGCTMSTKMLHQLDAEVASGKSDDLILQAFVQQYGAEVIAEPPAKGFNLLAWVMPFAVVGAGLFLIRAVLARWSQPSRAVPATSGAASPGSAPLDPEVIARIRRETEEDE